MASSAEEDAGMAEGIPLTSLATGQSGVVMELSGGPGFMARCLALGFTPGASVMMVQNFGRGPIIVSVRDTRVALGRGVAQRILVRNRAVHGG